MGVSVWQITTVELLFTAMTDASGNIATQEVFEYTRTSSLQIFYTPITLETTKAGYASDARQVLLTGNRSLSVILQAVSRATRSTCWVRDFVPG